MGIVIGLIVLVLVLAAAGAAACSCLPAAEAADACEPVRM